MATYYFYQDATGSSDGSSEADAYDGSTTAVLPNGTSAACRLDDVVGALQSGDKLYVKKSTSAITWFNSETTVAQTTDGPTDFVDGSTSYGRVEIIGYGTTITDGVRPDVNMGGKTWQFRRRCGLIKNFNFSGTYTGAGVLQLDTGAIMTDCRVENTNTAATAIAVNILSEGIVDRCEIIGSQSVASPSEHRNAAVSIYPSVCSTLTNCYVEARNGGHGIYTRFRSGNFDISGNVINVNLDVDGAGNNSGNGIHTENISYNRGAIIHRNIIINGNDGIYLERSGSSSSDRSGSRIHYNLIANCANGINGVPFYNSKSNAFDANNIAQPVVSFNNFFYSNTASNSYLNHETNATILSSDPFADVAGKDFTISGAELIANFGYASSFNQPGASGDTATVNALMPHSASAGSVAVERGVAF